MVFTTKSMLRLKDATSGLTDFTGGSFRPVLPGGAVDGAAVRRVLLCSGKASTTWMRTGGTPACGALRSSGSSACNPIPDAELAAGLARFPRDTEVRWVQEEAGDQGAWSFVRPHVERWGADRSLELVGRPPATAPAVGSSRRHAAEQKELLEAAFR